MSDRSRLSRELMQFAVVGGIGFVIDIAVFNLLRATIFSPGNLAAGPILAKVFSTSLAITANCIGNRWWTFMHRRRADVLREAVEFALGGITGSAIALVLGSLGRFTLYQKYVFSLERVRHSASGGLANRALTTRTATSVSVRSCAKVDRRLGFGLGHWGMV